MRLRFPYCQENFMQDQPYPSLLLVAPDCDLSCPGCHNGSLQGQEVRDISVDKIAREYKKNVFVEGITVGGLEICLSGEEFLFDLRNLIQKAGVEKLTLYTRFNLSDAKLRRIISFLDLDQISEFFVKTGRYIGSMYSRRETLVHDISGKSWTLKLGSSAQAFHVIKGDWSVISDMPLTSPVLPKNTSAFM